MEKVHYIISRFKNPIDLSSKYRQIFMDYLKRYGGESIKIFVSNNDPSVLTYFSESGFFSQEIIHSLINLAKHKNSREVLDWLTDYKKKQGW